MADVYEVVQPDVKFEDAPADGDEVLTTLRRKWADQGDGSYAPQVDAVVVLSETDVDIQQLNGNDIALGNGAVDAGTQRVTIASDSTGVIEVSQGDAGDSQWPIKSAGDTISQTPTVTAGAYSANDTVGGLLTFANAAMETGGGGVIKTVVIIDDAGQDAELELWLFNQTFTAMVDNAAWAPSEADLENLVGVISTEDSAQGWLDAGTPSAITIDVSTRYDLIGTSLFGQLVTRGTPTFAAADDVTVKVGLLQD